MRSLLVALIASVSTFACAAPAEEEAEDVGSSEDAVVRGTATFERPEIGAVWRGGGLCTGTLVRPNVVLTAAHCVAGSPKDEDATTASPGYVFEIRKSETERHRYAVDRLYSLPTAADFDGSQRWRVKDIALLRLAEDVPSSVATPASLATRKARLGGMVGIWGFGCTDRARGADGRRPGTGTKRKVEYRWNGALQLGLAHTQLVCPGDSGGPLLDAEANAVLGTNSGYVAWNDSFGDVPANRAALEAVISKWWPRR